MSGNQGPEYTQVELPLIQQLGAMGWACIEEDDQNKLADPSFTERDSFKDVLLVNRLREALLQINLDTDGQPWMDDGRLSQAISRLEKLSAHPLIECNQIATRLLLKGTPVEGLDGKNVTVRFIDYDHPERNDFLAVNQFRVDPPWHTGGGGYIIPDVVLFCNGIPLVVIECKRPDVDNPLTGAITQLLRYSNQRNPEDNEGAEQLFYYAQLMIATCRETARAGTVGADYRHYLAWKDTHPVPAAQVAAEAGVAVDELQGQHTLAGGLLRPDHLLDVVRCFTLFTEVNGKQVKIVPRYQQFRAVYKAIERLQTGKTKAEDGEHDRRGGIVWHTQGSGKSLTMVFLVRKMRTLPGLQRFKVVVVTDRTKLEKQLRDTAELTGEPPQRARTVVKLRQLLRQKGAGLVFGMIHKLQDAKPKKRGRQTAAKGKPARKPYPVLNDSQEILLLVDEAHRSHTSELHMNLTEALPNCAKIGFTGTPIMEEDKKPTYEIFGPYIDTYTILTSQIDESTVHILYEGRKVAGDVAGRRQLDAQFQETFWEYTDEEREAIKALYATTGDVLEAKKLIGVKARDMLRHYAATVMPQGLKAQIAAVSRLAAVRYQEAFEKAREELVAELETLAAAPPAARQASPLAPALPHLDRLRKLKFVTVVSGLHNDKAIFKPWTNPTQQERQIADFKKPFDPEKDEGYTAIIAVKSMLLTGFDAPLEQALYIDRSMQGYELLQAIARTNRPHQNKNAGLVVDYFGLGRQVTRALEIYTDSDRQGAFRSIVDELPRLDARHQRVVALFTSRNCDLVDTDSCVDLLYDAQLRARFTVLLREFLQTLDTILPRPEARPYVGDAKQLGLIRTLARNRYRDQQLNTAGAEDKVRRLIDEHVVGQGIDPTVSPIDILAADFERHVGAIRTPRAQAAEMEHALRHHIRRHYQEDPVYYQRLSERLEQILQLFEDNWEAQIQALQEVIRKHSNVQTEVSREERRMRPFLRLLANAVPGEQVTPEEQKRLAQATVELVGTIRAEVQHVDFLRNNAAQEKLRSRIAVYLDDEDLVPYDQVQKVADEMLQTAKANYLLLTESDE